MKKHSLIINLFLFKKRKNNLIFILVILICVLYVKVFKNQFTNWDDDIYVMNNPFIRTFSLENIKSIFKNYFIGNYHPLTLLTYSLNYFISNLNPWSYQLFNVILHLLNVYLVYVFISYILELKLGRKGDRENIISFIVALLFGINTMHVESVVWISERKNVLYGFFFFISLIYYLKYIKFGYSKYYLISLLMFVMSLLSKGMAVTLTVSLVVIDYFLGRRLLSREVIFEKVPYLILSLVFGIIAIKAQRESGAMLKELYIDLIDRIAIASHGLVQYIIRLIYPHRLSAYYPYPVKVGERLPFEYYGSILLVVIGVVVLIYLVNRNKIVVGGMMFFIANVITVLQLLPVGDAVMADRYVYVSSVGLFFVVGYYLVELYERNIKYRNILISLFVLYVYLISLKTYQRIGVWRDSLSLWNDSIKKYPINNDRGYLNRGNALFENGMYIEALRDYNELLKIDPHNNGGYIGRALVKQVLGEFNGAIEDYNKALKLKKSYEGYLNRAVLKMLQCDYDNALKDLDSASNFGNVRAGVDINKGVIYYEKENYEQALKCFNRAIEKEPSNYKAYIGRGKCFMALAEYEKAMNDFNVSLKYKASFEGYINRSSLKILLKDYQGAINDIEKSKLFNQYKSEIYLNSGIIEMENKNFKKAMVNFLKAIELDSMNYRNHLYMGILKYNESKYDSAIYYLNKSLALKPDKNAYFYLGKIYLYLQDLDLACRNFKLAFLKNHKESKIEFENNCKLCNCQ